MVTFLQRNTYTHFIIMYYHILTKCSCKLFSKFDEMRNFTRPWCFQSFWWLNSFFRNQTAEICNVIFVHICLKSKKSAIWGGKINTIGFFFIAVLKIKPLFLEWRNIWWIQCWFSLHCLLHFYILYSVHISYNVAVSWTVYMHQIVIIA